MVYEKEYLPQFREAEANGYIGVRGYMNYFQDMATSFMHVFGKGNDTLPEQYGIAWMYTKYRLEIAKQADFTDELHMECWTPIANRARAVQLLEIGRGEELYARGRLESCLIDMQNQRLCPLSAVEFPESVIEAERDNGVDEFEKLNRKPNLDELEALYTHVVQYTDLDKSHHMNNLRYVDLFLNAFGPEYFEDHMVRTFELHFVSQCFYGETLTVSRMKQDAGSELLYALKKDQTIAAICKWTY